LPRAEAVGHFQYTLRRESCCDGGFASRKAQPEISNLHPSFAKQVQNASNCGVSIMKSIMLVEFNHLKRRKVRSDA
jgi:hypothetical protein